MGLTAGIVSGAGAVAGAAGAVLAGNASKDAYDAKAAEAEQNISANTQMGVLKVQHQQRNAAQQIGATTAQYSAGGIDTSAGSALDVIGHSTQQAAQDTQQIQAQTTAENTSLQMGANSDIESGNAAQEGGYLSAVGSIFSGAGNGASTALKFAG